jgi:hypothetical protein
VLEMPVGTIAATATQAGDQLKFEYWDLTFLSSLTELTGNY